MAEFFDMGGYAAYIWPAFGISALVLVGILVASIKSLRNNEATLAALQAAEGISNGNNGESA